jgi:hypothetical protein
MTSYTLISISHAFLIIKAAIIYYTIQFLAVQYQTVKLHRTPPTHSLQTTNDIVFEEKIDVIYKTRNHLVASQIEAMKDLTLDNEELLQITNKKSAVLQRIRDNMKQIKSIESEVIKFVKDSFTSASNITIGGKYLNPRKMAFSEIASFLLQESFAGYTNDELFTLSESFLEKISSAEQYDEMEVNLFPKAKSTSDGEFDCERFLTRKVSLNAKQQFANRGTLESIIVDLQSTMENIKMDPLKDDTKILISQASTKKSNQIYIDARNQIDGLIGELKDFVATESVVHDVVDRSDCATMDDFNELLKVALGAYKERESVFDAVSEIVDNVEKIAFEEHSGSDRGNVTGKERALKDLLSLPLYPKVIQKIDSSIEQFTGFSDILDRMIDSMGGGEEGGVAKRLDSVFNTIMKKFNNAMEFFSKEKYWQGSR